MKCFYCQKQINGNGILLDADGDFVCDEICKTGYEKAKDNFLNRIVHNEKLTERWLLGEDV